MCRVLTVPIPRAILLDQKFIGQYVAAATIEITSADPYIPTRTRANEAYTVKVTSSNQQWTSAYLSGAAPELSWDPLSIVLNARYEKQEVDGSIISSGLSISKLQMMKLTAQR